MMTTSGHPPIKRNGIDTHRDGNSSGVEARVTGIASAPIIRSVPNPDYHDLTVQHPDASASQRYRAPMTSSVNSVITAIDINRPGMSITRRNLLLFFAQGHYLALGGDALFAEALYATDDGVELDDLPVSPTIISPSNGALNIINAVLLRYADLSAADLRTLVHAADPWRLAIEAGAGTRIEWAWLRDWFTRPAEVDDPDSGRPTRTQLAARAAHRRT
jgi:uncharacterized phage-associated protein